MSRYFARNSKRVPPRYKSVMHSFTGLLVSLLWKFCITLCYFINVYLSPAYKSIASNPQETHGHRIFVHGTQEWRLFILSSCTDCTGLICLPDVAGDLGLLSSTTDSAHSPPSFRVLFDVREGSLLPVKWGNYRWLTEATFLTHRRHPALEDKTPHAKVQT